MADYEGLRSSNTAELQAAAHEYFADPESYAAFDLTPQLRPVVGCIDPRDEASDRLVTTVQTAGGAVGALHDAALVDAAGSTRTIPLWKEVSGLNWTEGHVVTAHGNICKFLFGEAAILEEQAQPGDFTRDTLDRWMYEEDFKDAGKPLKAIAEAARRQHDEQTMSDAEAEALLDRIGSYGGQNGIIAMSGDNKAVTYIINHHPHVGLNRHRLHRELHSEAHAYHDSLGAIVAALGAETIHDYAHEKRGLMLAAILSRSAATRSVILSSSPALSAVEIYPSSRGIRMREVK